MIWYRDYETPGTKSFTVKKDLLQAFKSFCKKEFEYQKNDIYTTFEDKVENNIFLSDFTSQDKEYLKMVLALLKSNNLQCNISDVNFLLESDRLSFPPSIVLSNNEANVFVLKKACLYMSMSLEKDLTWLDVLRDLSIVTADEFFISSEFRARVEESRKKVKSLMRTFYEIDKAEKEFSTDILVKPLLSTELIIKLPQSDKMLIEELWQQEVIHPCMKVPASKTNEVMPIIEYAMMRPVDNAMWFIQRAILNCDDWLNYCEMHEHFKRFYIRFFENDANGKKLINPKKNFEINLGLIEGKCHQQEMNDSFKKITDNNAGDDSLNSDFKL